MQIIPSIVFRSIYGLVVASLLGLTGCGDALGDDTIEAGVIEVIDDGFADGGTEDSSSTD